jgi:hypothetical protein
MQESCVKVAMLQLQDGPPAGEFESFHHDTSTRAAQLT